MRRSIGKTTDSPVSTVRIRSDLHELEVDMKYAAIVIAAALLLAAGAAQAQSAPPPGSSGPEMKAAHRDHGGWGGEMNHRRGYEGGRGRERGHRRPEYRHGERGRGWHGAFWWAFPGWRWVLRCHRSHHHGFWCWHRECGRGHGRGCGHGHGRRGR
jgi:hypothetical protein